MRYAENQYNEYEYVTCAKYKNLPKKHVDVCKSCKWNSNCDAYNSYIAPYLPFPDFKELLKGPQQGAY